jgi:glycerol-3-phosphate dehydrogenase
MAKQVVDRMVDRDDREAPCRTNEIQLGMEASDEDLKTGLELPDGALDQLAFRYGHAARTVLGLAAESPELAEPIVAGRPDLLAEVVLAARAEQARSVADVLLRRTRLGILAAPDLRDGQVPRKVAELLGGELGWSSKRIGEEAAAWAEVAAREGLDPAGLAGASSTS